MQITRTGTVPFALSGTTPPDTTSTLGGFGAGCRLRARAVRIRRAAGSARPRALVGVVRAAGRVDRGDLGRRRRRAGRRVLGGTSQPPQSMSSQSAAISDRPRGRPSTMSCPPPHSIFASGSGVPASGERARISSFPLPPISSSAPPFPSSTSAPPRPSNLFAALSPVIVSLTAPADHGLDPLRRCRHPSATSSPRSPRRSDHRRSARRRARRPGEERARSCRRCPRRRRPSSGRRSARLERVVAGESLERVVAEAGERAAHVPVCLRSPVRLIAALAE